MLAFFILPLFSLQQSKEEKKWKMREKNEGCCIQQASRLMSVADLL